eukprot:TRINITY_DN10735_c0_g1_i2.p1 TRINITY_DN10735_c0_g1~~TRINITY_DN10735_c0_g1_i2.p1  ORF type:complete len:615 (+),score=122.15 TRINITY_DN10735_c0_g1_i2:162-2006(+)
MEEMQIVLAQPQTPQPSSKGLGRSTSRNQLLNTLKKAADAHAATSSTPPATSSQAREESPIKKKRRLESEEVSSQQEQYYARLEVDLERLRSEVTRLREDRWKLEDATKAARRRADHLQQDSDHKEHQFRQQQCRITELEAEVQGLRETTLERTVTRMADALAAELAALGNPQERRRAQRRMLSFLTSDKFPTVATATALGEALRQKVPETQADVEMQPPDTPPGRRARSAPALVPVVRDPPPSPAASPMAATPSRPPRGRLAGLAGLAVQGGTTLLPDASPVPITPLNAKRMPVASPTAWLAGTPARTPSVASTPALSPKLNPTPARPPATPLSAAARSTSAAMRTGSTPSRRPIATPQTARTPSRSPAASATRTPPPMPTTPGRLPETPAGRVPGTPGQLPGTPAGRLPSTPGRQPGTPGRRLVGKQPWSDAAPMEGLTGVMSVGEQTPRGSTTPGRRARRGARSASPDASPEPAFGDGAAAREEEAAAKAKGRRGGVKSQRQQRCERSGSAGSERSGSPKTPPTAKKITPQTPSSPRRRTEIPMVAPAVQGTPARPARQAELSLQELATVRTPARATAATPLRAAATPLRGSTPAAIRRLIEAAPASARRE